MAESTYIGPKGYTIYTAALEPAEQKQLKTELTVRPFMPKAPVQPEAFPIFRQSSNGQKLYVPRFYGLDTYGVPDGMRVPKGTPIAVPLKATCAIIRSRLSRCTSKPRSNMDPRTVAGAC